MKKSKIKYIPISIYRLTLTVFVGTFKEFYDFIKQGAKGRKDFAGLLERLEEDKEYSMLSAATYWNGTTRTPIIYLPDLSTKPRSLGNACHELGHVTRAILDDIGVKTTVDNDEAFQYLQGWLMEQIYISRMVMKNYRMTKENI